MPGSTTIYGRDLVQELSAWLFMATTRSPISPGAIPVRGQGSLAYVHDGVAYRFSSEAHRDAFEANPDRFVPQYGGFCAYGVSVGKKFDGDPQLWKVEDGRLYLNLNEEIYATFLEDIDGNIHKADGDWPEIEHTAARDL